MPVSGFPTILENILNSLFQESQLASYKLAGNQQKTTLVLRFDAMADTSVSTSHLSTPAEARLKSPSQLRRDRRRLHHRYLLSKEDAPVCLHNTEPEANQTPIINRTETAEPAKLDLGLTLSRSDRPSQQELSESPKYTLPQQPLSAAILPTSINAQDSKDCCKSDTPMLTLDSQDTRAAEKPSETTVPDQELVRKKQESKFDENAVSVSSSQEVNFRVRPRFRSTPSLSHKSRSSRESSTCISAD
ncbi:hypothetical protein ElyMa_002354900 [Elysia marginata]|uniref:Uncharacterized protein n=1 Tax=Elysia marginata TaxID=1093978 RepID=A0AAV4G890_9GAST|nr:hypothetical protein ElyMa_002354900 [Elysia marginata]